MSSRNFECLALKWDTDYFGVNSARVNLIGIISEQDQVEILEFCKDYDFVTISNLDNKNENNYWLGEKTTAFLADVNIQFSKVLANIPDLQDETTCVMNALAKNKQVVEIAKKSFKYSRFFNDPNLPQEQAKNIYLHWTECAFGSEDKYFVLAKREDEVAGYLLFSVNENCSVIELIAVDEKHQGQRVGKSLIQAMESFVCGLGISKIKVGTQLNNIQATQFYYAMGFNYFSCGSIYHLWEK